MDEDEEQKKREGQKKKKREKNVWFVKSSNIEFEHLIPVTNMSNLSFEGGQ